MQKRRLLRRQLIEAWKETIKDYGSQLINSERGLQIYFCHALFRLFEEAEAKRRALIEPCIKADGERFYPDVLICNARKVIGIVELKYLPRGRPKVGKDLASLKKLAFDVSSLTVRHDRYRGEHSRKHNYAIADDAILCWAGIYTGHRLSLEQGVDEAHRERFVQLDALTADGRAAEVHLG